MQTQPSRRAPCRGLPPAVGVLAVLAEDLGPNYYTAPCLLAHLKMGMVTPPSRGLV